MAIDTAAKRFSAMNILNPWRGPSTLPSGAIGQASRQSLNLLYNGILSDIIGSATSTYRMMMGYGL